MTRCDCKGRIYLKEALRARYRERFVVIEAPDAILLPVPDDPVTDLAELGRAIPNLSLKALKSRIRQRGKKEAMSRSPTDGLRSSQTLVTRI